MFVACLSIHPSIIYLLYLFKLVGVALVNRITQVAGMDFCVIRSEYQCPLATLFLGAAARQDRDFEELRAPRRPSIVGLEQDEGLALLIWKPLKTFTWGREESRRCLRPRL